MSTFVSVQELSDIVLAERYQLGSVVILFFDYFLTLDLEWENIWQRKWTCATLLFFINRYFPMLSYIAIIVSLHDPSWSEESCQEFIRLPFYMVLISETVIAMIVSLRLYALYLQRWQVPVCMAFVYISQLAWGILASRGISTDIAPAVGQGCVAYVEDWAYNLFAVYIGNSALFDCMVFILTLYKTLRFRPRGFRIPLSDLFLRDGVVYFAVMLTAKIVNFVVFYAVSRNLITITWTLNHTITVIMISRLMLNLREHDTLRRKASGTSATYDTVSLLYASVIGNLGGAVDADAGDEKFSFDSERDVDDFTVPMKWEEVMEDHDDGGHVDWDNVVSVQKLNYTGNMV